MVKKQAVKDWEYTVVSVTYLFVLWASVHIHIYRQEQVLTYKWKKPFLLCEWDKQDIGETGVNVATEMWIQLVTNVKSVQFF